VVAGDVVGAEGGMVTSGVETVEEVVTDAEGEVEEMAAVDLFC